VKATARIVTALGLALLVFVQTASAAIFTLTPTDDVLVDFQNGDVNLGSEPVLGTNLAFLSPRAFTYMKFDLSEIPATERIVGATLNLFQINGAGFGESGVFLLRNENDDWTEDTPTWNNPPTPGGTGVFLDLNENGQFYRGYSQWDLLENGAWDPAIDRADGFLSLQLGEASSNDQARNWCSKESTVDTCSFDGTTGLPFLEVETVLVPLPAALPLLGTGLAALWGLAWRRRSV
jgi:hypothetical protein